MTDSAATDDSPYVEVVYALPDEQAIVPVPWAAGMTARVAVERSNLAARFPQIVSADVVPGIYGVRISWDQVLRPGDRVEVCRPLVADPRRMRFDLMSDGRVMGGRETTGDGPFGNRAPEAEPPGDGSPEDGASGDGPPEDGASEDGAPQNGAK